jgi:hypothetical protein
MCTGAGSPAASPSPEAVNMFGEATPHAHELEQLQRNLAAAVKAGVEKIKDIQSLDMFGLLGAAYGKCLPMTITYI